MSSVTTDPSVRACVDGPRLSAKIAWFFGNMHSKEHSVAHMLCFRDNKINTAYCSHQYRPRTHGRRDRHTEHPGTARPLALNYISIKLLTAARNVCKLRLMGSGYTFRYADIDIAHSSAPGLASTSIHSVRPPHTCALCTQVIIHACTPVRTHYDSASASRIAHAVVSSRTPSRAGRMPPTAAVERGKWSGGGTYMRCMRTGTGARTRQDCRLECG